MRTGRPKAKLVLSSDERAKLEELARTSSARPGLARRAQVVLLCAAGLSNCEVARRTSLSAHTVGVWRARYSRWRASSLWSAGHTGGRTPIPAGKVDVVLALALDAVPVGNAARSIRQITEAVGISHNSVHRICRSFGIEPQRGMDLMLSSAAPAESSTWDVVGIYLKPPAHVLVVCAEEGFTGTMKETQPTPPRRPRRSAREILASDDSETLLPSEVVSLLTRVEVECGFPYGSPDGYCEFLRQIQAAVPEHLDVHLIVDKCDQHKTKKVRDWMLKHPRVRLHIASTHDAWLDQVDRWFRLASRRCRVPIEHQSEVLFHEGAKRFLDAFDQHAGAFAWSKPRQAVAEKLAKTRG